MPKLTKSQKQLIGLAAVLATIVFVLAAYVFKPAVPVGQDVFTPPIVTSSISKDILAKPEYRGLNMPINLPLVPGVTGRPNPFDPYH